ncbi:hypothetical protein BC828DRAFT_436772 [Blastocladiella britannica]|nr:hypothetical protein BC828DRAFT_436772 [Blastocladiella britannica]
MNIPNLVLDRIFCHLIGGTKAHNACPDDWSACLMVVYPAQIPGFVRCLLRQCPSFAIFKSGPTASLPLLRIWLTHFTPREFGLDNAGPLLAYAIRRHDLDGFEWLCKYCANEKNNFPLTVTAAMVDSASTNGVLMLDRLWQLYCDQLHLLPADSPSTFAAFDSAQDWWQKHTQFGLPLVYLEAVYSAMMGRIPRDVLLDAYSGSRRPRPIVTEDRPIQLAICQWWRDRATMGGLKLSIQTVDTIEPNDWDYEDEDEELEDQEILRPFNNVDLVLLGGDWDRLDLLEAWVAIVDSALLPPASMDFLPHYGDPLQVAEIFNSLVLDWWWQRYVEHRLVPPDVQSLTAGAYHKARVDTLGWIWRKSSSHPADGSPNPLPFVVPEKIHVSQDAMTTILPWWFARAESDPHLEMPVIEWQANDDDTLEDMQAFWDLQSDPRASAFRFLLPSGYYPTDIRLIPWMTERRANNDSKCFFWYTFEHLWKKRRTAVMADERGVGFPYDGILEYTCWFAHKSSASTLLSRLDWSPNGWTTTLAASPSCHLIHSRS